MSVLGNISSIVLTVSNISPSFFHCSFEIVVDRIDRVLAHVTASSVRAHGVVVDQPDIRVVLWGFHTLVELVAEGWLEELIKNGAIEPFRKTICLRAEDLYTPLLDFVERLVYVVRMTVCSGPLHLDSFFVILRGWSEPDERAARRFRTQVVSDTPGTNGYVSSCIHLRGNVQSGNGRWRSHYTRINPPPLP